MASATDSAGPIDVGEGMPAEADWPLPQDSETLPETRHASPIQTIGAALRDELDDDLRPFGIERQPDAIQFEQFDLGH